MLDQQPQEMEESIKHCASSMPHGHGTVLGRSLAASPQEHLEVPFVLPVKGAVLWRLGSTSIGFGIAASPSCADCIWEP